MPTSPLTSRLLPRGGTLPLGSHTRSRRSWILPIVLRLSTGAAAVAGQFAQVALYNNSVTGKILSIFEFACLLPGSGEVVRLTYGGLPALTLVGPGLPSWAGQPAGDGAIYQGTAATIPANSLADYVAVGTTQFVLRGTEPIFRLPPGYSLIATCTGATIAITAVGFEWAPEPY